MEQNLPRAVLATAVLAFFEGGFMVVDSVHRFMTGDFFRIDGQLGPWSAIVSSLGGDPLAMGPIFLGLGGLQVTGGLALLMGRRWGVPLVLATAVGTLWYLIFGTLASALQIALLLKARRRYRPASDQSTIDLPTREGRS